jgi:alkanesulfonate monooxygenase
MRFDYNTESVEVFTISPRTTDAAEYWPNIEQVIQWSDHYGATGILLFEGNDTFISPWIAAHEALKNTESLAPLVAVNPVYMHPFAAAKMVSTFAYLYGRRTYLNMITGTALSYLEALDDQLDKKQRYVRLREYSELIQLLVSSQGQPVTYEGQYYTTKNLKLDPPVPDELQPVFYIAGQSEGAVETARAIDAVHMQMLSSELDGGIKPGATGIHLGIVTREDGDEAWEVAERLFPADKSGQRMQTFSMGNTDSVWKQRMMMAAKLEEGAREGFWLEPFRNFKADCPYFIGSREATATLIAGMVRNGVRHIILDVPRVEREFAEIKEACALAGELLAAATPASL